MKPQYTFCCYVTILSHTHSFTEKREWSMWWGAKMRVGWSCAPLTVHWHITINIYGDWNTCGWLMVFHLNVTLFSYLVNLYLFTLRSSIDLTFFISIYIPIQAKMNDGGIRQWEFKFGLSTDENYGMAKWTLRFDTTLCDNCWKWMWRLMINVWWTRKWEPCLLHKTFWEFLFHLFCMFVCLFVSLLFK